MAYTLEQSKFNELVDEITKFLKRNIIIVPDQEQEVVQVKIPKKRGPKPRERIPGEENIKIKKS